MSGFVAQSIEHDALRATAAETDEIVVQSVEASDGGGGIGAKEVDDRGPRRDADFTENSRVFVVARLRRRSHRLEIAVGARRPSRRRERQEIMDVGEGEKMITDITETFFSDVGESLPLRRHVASELFQAEEQRARVADVAIVEGRVAGDAFVVEDEGFVDAVEFEEEQGFVPRDVTGEVVARFEGRAILVEPANALSVTPGLEQNVRDGVNGPDVVGVRRDRIATDGLGGVEIAGFFDGEGETASDISGSCVVWIDAVERTFERSAHPVDVADHEPAAVLELGREQVARVIAENARQELGGAARFSGMPRGEGVDVATFALRRTVAIDARSSVFESSVDDGREIDAREKSGT